MLLGELQETSASLAENDDKKRFDKTPKPRRQSKIEEAENENESMEIDEELNTSIQAMNANRYQKGSKVSETRYSLNRDHDGED